MSKTYCQNCSKDKNKLVFTGEKVCTWCYWFKIECEARHILKMPFAKRKLEIEKRNQIRGESKDLIDAIFSIYKKGKA